ncbi:MAG: hypothetical protein HQK93_09235, partial [Nitrospirae bacterium]|nr:hypothetical protein [Nitrospirota bacterium]
HIEVETAPNGEAGLKKLAYSSYPQNLELNNEETLVSFKDGEWYSIKKFKIVTGQIENIDENSSIESMKILVYSNKGELMLTKDISNKAVQK